MWKDEWRRETPGVAEGGRLTAQLTARCFRHNPSPPPSFLYNLLPYSLPYTHTTPLCSRILQTSSGTSPSSAPNRPVRLRTSPPLPVTPR